ncbi:Cas10/Cmr2 second palm domain-containing protein [Clostridium oceanicum]
MFVVKVDIGSKQKYIFSSNRLKEIIGASEIIRYVTEELAKEVLKCMNREYKNYENSNDGNVLFEAGGNSMYIFDDIDDAKKFNGIFSRFVIEYFDGLELIMVIKEFDIEKRNIVDLYEEIEQALTKKKGERKYQFKRLGYGLTRICPNTRKPAGYEYKEKDRNNKGKIKYISKESEDKLRFYNFLYGNSNYYDEQAKIKYMIDSKEINHEQMKKELKERYGLKNGFEFTNKLDDIAGPKNEGSHIGITCIDGNGMGKKIDSFNDEYKRIPREKIFDSNQKYIKEFRNLTKNIDEHYRTTFNKVLEDLVDNYNNYYEKIGYEKEKKTLPIRPIILAGDDITFISNGKIAIDITRLFTEEITEQKEQFGKNKYNLTTSAGIAIVKRNHPFSRAVKLAGALEKNSKKKLRTMKLACEKQNLEKLEDASFIDWEINRGDTLDNILIIRNKDLVARPYIIIDSESKKKIDIHYEDLKSIINYNFDNFDNALDQINKSGARSNIKSFFRSMNSSEIDSDLFYLKYNLKGKFEGDVDLKVIKKVIYDVVDAMDLYTYVKGDK